MPVYNGEKYLREAIESILGQFFGDFEFIIINDGSTDSTETIIKSFNDDRIVYINNPNNLGLSKSLNIGIRAAKGKYIARMDADDISLPERFEKQIEFLEKNLEISIVGTAAKLIDENRCVLKIICRPKTHFEIKWQSLFSTPMFHPTIMARVNVLKENLFDEKLFNSEDYELWSRLLFTTSTRFTNMSEALLLYRVYKNSFTQSLGVEKRTASATNSISNIRHFTSITDIEADALIKLRQGMFLKFKELFTVWHIYTRAAKGFRQTENYRPTLFPLFLFLTKHKLRKLFAKGS